MDSRLWLFYHISPQCHYCLQVHSTSSDWPLLMTTYQNWGQYFIACMTDHIMTPWGELHKLHKVCRWGLGTEVLMIGFRMAAFQTTFHWANIHIISLSTYWVDITEASLISFSLGGHFWFCRSISLISNYICSWQVFTVALIIKSQFHPQQVNKFFDNFENQRKLTNTTIDLITSTPGGRFCFIQMPPH